MKIGFVSLGCCKNLVDSEQIMSISRGVVMKLWPILRMHRLLL